uniref:Cystatin domain-containing protein n=1 Tax=Lates calcarifer TaxID=8187 RepID=A0A4W6DUQ1_LATCA
HLDNTEVTFIHTKVVTVARFAVVEFNKANTEDQFSYKIVNITSVVAGINYILDVQLGRTVCKKSDTADEVPWEDSRILTRKKCHEHKC